MASLKKDRFIVVSDVFPTPTTDVADVILPSAMWIEREGMYGNSERRTQHFNQLVNPPGEAMSDTWQIIEVARRMGYEKLFPWSPEEEHIEKIWNEYRQHHEGNKARHGSVRSPQSQPGGRLAITSTASPPCGASTLKYDPACKEGH